MWKKAYDFGLKYEEIKNYGMKIRIKQKVLRNLPKILFRLNKTAVYHRRFLTIEYFVMHFIQVCKLNLFIILHIVKLLYFDHIHRS